MCACDKSHAATEDTPREALVRFYEVCSGEKEHDLPAVFSEAPRYREELGSMVAFSRALLRFQTAVKTKYGPAAWDEYLKLKTKVNVNFKGPPFDRSWYEKVEVKSTSTETAEAEVEQIGMKISLVMSGGKWLVDVSKQFDGDAQKKRSVVGFYERMKSACEKGCDLCKENLSLADLKEKVSRAYLSFTPKSVP